MRRVTTCVFRSFTVTSVESPDSSLTHCVYVAAQYRMSDAEFNAADVSVNTIVTYWLGFDVGTKRMCVSKSTRGWFAASSHAFALTETGDDAGVHALSHSVEPYEELGSQTEPAGNRTLLPAPM